MMCANDICRTVYMSAAANALRVAKTAPSLTELVRIATGEPRADTAPHPPDADVTVWVSRDHGADVMITAYQGLENVRG